MFATGESSPRGSCSALLVLIAAVGLFALSQTAVIPAVGTIAEEFDTSLDSAAWVLSAYLASAAVLTPLLGGLSDRFGRRRMLVVALSLFAVGAALAAVAQSLGVLIIARILQGAGGGILPISFGIVREQLPTSAQPRAVAALSAVIGVGGGLGLLCGAWVLDIAEYRTIFAAGCALAVLATLGVPGSVRRSPTAGGRAVDLVEAVALAVVVVSALLVVDGIGSASGPSSRTVPPLVVLPLALIILFRRARKVEVPLVDTTILTIAPVLRANLVALLTGFAIFSVFVIVPHMATTGPGQSRPALTAALVLLPGCLLQLPLGAVAARAVERSARPGRVLLPGCLLAASGQAGLLMESGVVATAVWTSVALGGLGIIFAIIPNLLFQVVPLDRTGQASGLNSLVRMLGGAFGAQVSGMLIVASPEGVKHALMASIVTCIVAGGLAFIPSGRT